MLHLNSKIELSEYSKTKNVFSRVLASARNSEVYPPPPESVLDAYSLLMLLLFIFYYFHFVLWDIQISCNK